MLAYNPTQEAETAILEARSGTKSSCYDFLDDEL